MLLKITQRHDLGVLYTSHHHRQRSGANHQDRSAHRFDCRFQDQYVRNDKKRVSNSIEFGTWLADKAAVVIQRNWRMHWARTRYRERRDKMVTKVVEETSDNGRYPIIGEDVDGIPETQAATVGDNLITKVATLARSEVAKELAEEAKEDGADEDEVPDSQVDDGRESQAIVRDPNAATVDEDIERDPNLDDEMQKTKEMQAIKEFADPYILR